MARILTVGHSTHDAEDFLALLGGQAVEALVDVRRYPSSRRFPHFNAAELDRALAAAGIGYLHLEALGGRRDPIAGSPNSGWRAGQFQGYADHMASEEFLADLRTLEGLARRSATAVMCAEAGWWRCHRRLLADALLVNGWAVLHIDARGTMDLHELTEFAVAEDGRLSYPPAQAELPGASSPGS